MSETVFYLTRALEEVGSIARCTALDVSVGADVGMLTAVSDLKLVVVVSGLGVLNSCLENQNSAALVLEDGGHLARIRILG